MTYSYSERVATCATIGNFGLLLFKIKNSIYSLLWLDTILYIVVYYILQFVYIFYLSADEKPCPARTFFQHLAIHINDHENDLPITYVLGSFISIVFSRWWNQFMQLPWPDSTHILVATLINGQDDEAVEIRRGIMRYVNLAFALTLAPISVRGRERFPTLESMVQEGIMNIKEKEILEKLDKRMEGTQPLHWIPIVWAHEAVSMAYQLGKINDQVSANSIRSRLNEFRFGCQKILNYYSNNIPLALTQVVTLAVYAYTAASLVSTQLFPFTETHKHFYFPFPLAGLMKFVLYMGLLKVAETLINPYGLNTDDFDFDFLIDRYFKVSYFVVDDMHQEHPNLLKDNYWEQVVPTINVDPETDKGQYGSAEEYEVQNDKRDAAGSATSLVEQINEAIVTSLTEDLEQGEDSEKRDSVEKDSTIRDKRLASVKAKLGSGIMIKSASAKSIPVAEEKEDVAKLTEELLQSLKDQNDVTPLMESEDVVYVPEPELESLSGYSEGSDTEGQERKKSAKDQPKP